MLQMSAVLLFSLAGCAAETDCKATGAGVRWQALLSCGEC